MNKCYSCRHRGTIPGDCHTCCNHPEAKSVEAMSYLITGKSGDFNIVGDPHAIKRGWFFWPLNFDPVWLQNCDKYQEKETKAESGGARTELCLAIAGTYMFYSIAVWFLGL